MRTTWCRGIMRIVGTITSDSQEHVSVSRSPARRTLFQGHGRKPFQGASGRVDGDADRFERGHAEDRFDPFRTEDDPPGRDLSHELDLREAELVFVDAAVSQLVAGSTPGMKTPA